jgi:hypothetical protein
VTTKSLVLTCDYSYNRNKDRRYRREARAYPAEGTEHIVRLLDVIAPAHVNVWVYGALVLKCSESLLVLVNTAFLDEEHALQWKLTYTEDD